MEKPLEDCIKIVLSVSRLEGDKTGIDPLLSRLVYDYEVPDPIWDWREIDRAASRLRKDLTSLSPARADFIGDFLTSFEVKTREGLGEVIPYQERVQAYLQVSGELIAEAVISTLRTSLQQKLTDIGFDQDLPKAYRLWTRSQLISKDDIFDRGRAILAETRRRTNLLVMESPPEHQIELNFPRNFPYNGYSDYSKGYRGRIFLNGDEEYTLSGLVHLICHEALPGHQLFSAIREKRYRDGLMPVEGTIYLANTPITPIVEGNCEDGQRMLGMYETTADEIYDLYNRYSSAVATNIAIACNADGMDRQTAVDKLVDLVFIDLEKASRSYAFFTHPLWQNSFPHYWYGRELMRQNYNLMADNLPEYYLMIYTEPHTVRTLQRRINQYLYANRKAANLK